MNKGQIHDSSQTETIDQKNRSRNKKRVQFPSGDKIVSHVFHTYIQNFEDCSSAELISFYVSGCLKNAVSPCDFLLEQLRGIDTSICNERYNKLSLRGIRVSSSHMEALEEIFKRVQFREVDFQDSYLDETCSGVLFDILKHYESCQELKITSTFDLPNHRSSWTRCLQYLRNSKELNAFHLYKSNLNREYFAGVNFTGFRLEKFSLIECNLGNDVRSLFYFTKALKNNFLFGSFGTNKILFDKLKEIIQVKKSSKLSSQNLLIQKFSDRYSSKLWKFAFNLKGNKLTSSVVEYLSIILTHNLILANISTLPFDLIGDRGFQIFRGNGYLYELNLSNNLLKDAGVQLIIKELVQNLNRNINRILINLIRLYNFNEFKNNEDILDELSKLSHSDVLRLAHVKKIYSLEILNLSNNSITSASMAKLGESISLKRVWVEDFPSPIHNFINLKCLDLSNNLLIGDSGVEVLCFYLTSSLTLKSLILRNCSFSFIGFYAIASYISETKTLDTLDVRENTVKLNSLMALSKTIEINNSLRILLVDSFKHITETMNPETDKTEIDLMKTFYDELTTYVHRNNSKYTCNDDADEEACESIDTAEEVHHDDDHQLLSSSPSIIDTVIENQHFSDTDSSSLN